MFDSSAFFNVFYVVGVALLGITWIFLGALSVYFFLSDDKIKTFGRFLGFSGLLLWFAITAGFVCGYEKSLASKQKINITKVETKRP
jgi:FtsH-binding integral membrane protein